MSFFGNYDFYTAVARGLVPKHSTVLMQGNNPNVDTMSPENLWELQDIFTYPTAGEQWEILSDDALDTFGGTGAQSAMLTYLDADYNEQTTTIDLNGTTPAIFTPINCFRPVLLRATSVGAIGTNAGLITVRVAGGGDNRIGIIAGGNRSLHGFYTVPAGKTAFLIQGYSTIQKGKDADISIFTTNGTDGIFFKQVPISIYQNSINFTFRAPIGPIFEKSEAKFLCETENNNTNVTASVQLLVIDND